MAQMKTPGVYILEKDAFGNGVVEVATAVPAFIGYTERHDNGGKSLKGKPTRITSIGDYMQFYGGAPTYKFTLEQGEADSGEETPAAEDGGETPAPAADDSNFKVKDSNFALNPTGGNHSLFNAMRLFFQNGGGPCYIVSVGSYQNDIDADVLREEGIMPLLKEEEPTMVVIPEAIHLAEENCVALQQAVLMHCEKMQSRVGILDIYNGDRARNHPEGDVIANFRGGVGVNALSYGMAYYPWLHTTIVGDSELGLHNFTAESLTVLQSMVLLEHGVAAEAAEGEDGKSADLRELLGKLPGIQEEGAADPSIEELNKTLIVISPTYNSILEDIKGRLNLLPPSSAMAGIYTLVDNNRGVWKAPANVSLNSVTTPAVNISHDEQEDLNVTLRGKSINAIRPFIGEGVLVWGARTLDGNSKDWRYINVRRTMIMLEQSIKAAAKAYVFEPNDANTWTTMKSMLDSFLFNQWKKGALVGASPDDAYSVSIGLGNTMTADDILEGILRITVLVAISRPAEFIEITFQQQMQKS